jgi:CHAP domain/LysM domain
MSKHRRRSNLIKFVITFVNLIIFNYVILYADKFQVKLDNLPVRADFVDTTINEDDLTSVRLDNVIIDDNAPGWNITYVIKAGDTLASVAQDVGTTINNIRMVNGLAADVDITKKGTVVNKEGIAIRKLTISQLPGIVVAMDYTTSVQEFAKNYDLNEEDIKALNNISDSKTILRSGDELFLTITEQDALKKGILASPTVDAPAKEDVVLAQTAPTKPGEIAKQPPVKPIAAAKPAGKKPVAQIVRAESAWSQHNDIIGYDEGTIIATWFQKDRWYAGFYGWQCTSYAASKRKDIFNSDKAFRGNAGSWWRNAKAAGNTVGSTPKKWAIAVFAPGRWASGYGHVAIVEEVDTKNGTIVITDMNYKGRNIVTKRVVASDLPVSYIY